MDNDLHDSVPVVAPQAPSRTTGFNSVSRFVRSVLLIDLILYVTAALAGVVLAMLITHA